MTPTGGSATGAGPADLRATATRRESLPPVYAQHFGLDEAPFAITPDPRYLYMSERHREALAHLLYGVGEGGGFVQLTGEVGTGKTTICRCLLEQLPPHVDVALILNPRLTAVELLAATCDELRVGYPAGATSPKPLVDALYRYLLDAHGRGRRTVLVVDEAQDLSAEALEQVRLLTNLETTREKLLQIVLIGQPELIDLLAHEGLRQLAQRVTARYHLEPLSREETRGYVQHRMAVAGRAGPVFSEAAVRSVHRLSGGVPRLINVICDRALLGAYTQDRRRVDAAIVRRAAAEVLGRGRAARGAWRAAVVAAAAAVALGIAGVAGVWVFATPDRLGPVVGRVRSDVSAPAPVAVAGPAPAGVAPAEPLPPRAATLGELLGDPSLRADRRTAMAALHARWGAAYPDSGPEPACERGRSGGPACLAGIGTWTKLRRFDLPAVLELVTPTGDRRHATVVTVEGERVTLDVGERRVTVRREEIDAAWEGAFLLLWKAPPVATIPLVPGARGRDVAWLRQRLGEVDGQRGAPPGGGVYDDELRERVMAFQRSRSLAPDGIVGAETLTQLSAVVREPGIPWLSAGRP